MIPDLEPARCPFCREIAAYVPKRDWAVISGEVQLPEAVCLRCFDAEKGESL